jgi:hypothetical protein
MTELVQTDSTEDVAADLGEDTGAIELGADLEAPAYEAPPGEETSQDPASTPPGRTTEKDASERPVEIPKQIGDVDVDSLPAELQPLAKQLKGSHTRGMQALAEQRRAAEAQDQQRLEERVNRLESPSPEESDPLTALRATLNVDEQRSLDVISEVSKMTVGKQVEEQTAKVDQLTEAVKRIAMHMIQGASTNASSAADQARAKYPDIDDYATQVNALVNVQNPATRQNYSLTEAYELIKGISAETSQNLQQEEETVRRAAAASTMPPSSVAADSDQGTLSENELAAKLKSLGMTP